jgi:CARDB
MHRPIFALFSAVGLLLAMDSIGGSATTSPPAGGATSPKPILKPDLVVTIGNLEHVAADLKGQRYFFRDVHYELTWKARTTNKPLPKGSVAARAPRSETGVFILRNGTWLRQDRLTVPRLAPGGSVLQVNAFNKFFPAALWQFGTYRVMVCADVGDNVKERNEDNNCLRLTRNDLYLVPRTLDGPVSGSFDFDGWLESWRGTIHLDLVENDNTGRFGGFDYIVDDSSTLNFVVAGTNPETGCSANGSGQTQQLHNFGQSTVDLYFDIGGEGAYNAFDSVSSGFGYPVVVTCPGRNPFVIVAPLNPCQHEGIHWVYSSAGRAFPDPGLVQLRGRHTDSCNNPIIWRWDLHPDVP